MRTVASAVLVVGLAGPPAEAQLVAYEGFGAGSDFVIQSVLGGAGYTVAGLSASDIAAGDLVSGGFETLLLSRGTTFGEPPPGYVEAIGAFVAAGGNIVTEWSGANIFFSDYDEDDIRSPADEAPQLGLFEGTIHSGHLLGRDTPITANDPNHPLFAGIPSPFAEGPGTEFFFWLETTDPDLELLATFPGNGSLFFPSGDLTCLATGCVDESAFVFGTWCWNDTLSTGGFNTQFLLNAVNYVTDADCTPPECFLVFGPCQGSSPFEPGIHQWTTQLCSITDYFAVTQDDLPSFALPSIDPRHKLELPAVDMSFSAQILMWNPEYFPAVPEQWSNGLRVTIWSNGQVFSQPFGHSNGMITWSETYWENSSRYLRFPFWIQGLGN